MSIIDWSGAIKITFDRIIINDPAVVLGTEEYKPKGTPTMVIALLSSGDYSGQPKENVFDLLTTTYWRSASATMPQWIGRDFGEAVTLTKVRAYLNTYKPGAYQMQGSANGTDWVDVATGTFTATTGWQDITFSATSYRYWRLYMTTRQSTYCYVYELEFLGTRNTYDVNGWTVSGQEQTMQPDGVLAAEVYTIRKITKTEDSLGIILWLNMLDRILAPEGVVTVAYDKTAGNLLGQGNLQVESFSITFTPTGLTSIINPNEHESLTALIQQIVTVSEVTYTDTRSPHEYITATIDLDITVTKVGDLPL